MQVNRPQARRRAAGFLSLGVDGLEHSVYYRYLSMWNDGKYIAGKVYCAALVFCIRVDLFKGFQHP